MPINRGDFGWWVRRVRFLLKPGLDLKRWLLLMCFGAVLLVLGIAFTSQVALSERTLSFLRTISLAQLPPLVRGSLFLGASLAVMGIAIWGLYSSLARLRQRRPGTTILEELYVQRVLGAGPKVVVLGGGTGLSNLLTGLKNYTRNLCAIVTVSDDGGSSGRLRQELGILPPGDIRNCLVALADSEEIMQRLMEHRFDGNGSLGGHSFGNLLIAALTHITGNFEDGVAVAGQILAIRGRVLPATLSNVVLTGETVAGRILVGESAIGQAGEPLNSVSLGPGQVEPFPPALAAIAEADMILIGPGSLYTSVIPNLLVPGIRETLQKTHCLKVYICNVAEQPGETDGFTVDDYIKTIAHYGSSQIFDVVVANDRIPHETPQSCTLTPPGGLRTPSSKPILWSDLIDFNRPTRHDTSKLSRFLMDLYQRHHRNPLNLSAQVTSTRP